MGLSMQSTELSGFKLDQRFLGATQDVLPLGDWYALQSAGAAFHALADTMPQMVWSTLPDGSHDYFNARWYEFTGVPEGSTDGEGWAGMFHEDDQPNTWKVWSHSLATGEPYEVEYRLRHKSGEYRWMIGRALPIRNPDGTIQRWIGTCTDIEDQKRISLQNELLSQELSHRIKNIFAIISGLISLTARTNQALAGTARELLDRIGALGRAHEYVRPQLGDMRQDRPTTNLVSLLEEIVAAYPAFSEGRLTIEGPAVEIDSRAATPVALVIHELATNALKYGSLSMPDGRVSLRFYEEDTRIYIDWTETGGPVPGSEPPDPGFGSKLIDMAVRQQLGGTYEREWSPSGMALRMDFPRTRLGGSNS